MKKVNRIAEYGDKIKVTKFCCNGWDKTEYHVGSIWIVNKVQEKPFGVTYCDGAADPIDNDKYIVLD